MYGLAGIVNINKYRYELLHFERRQEMAKGLIVAGFLVGIVLFALQGCTTLDGTKEAKEPEFVLRINCGAFEPYTDREGNVWLADQEMEPGKEWGAVGGVTVDWGDLEIADTNSPRVYQTERYNMDGYKFDLTTNGIYTIYLHFAETFYDIRAEGERVFSVIVNGRGFLEDFDVFKAAGGFQKPVVAMIEGVKVIKGELTIDFTPNVQNPEINGIEILSEKLD